MGQVGIGEDFARGVFGDGVCGVGSCGKAFFEHESRAMVEGGLLPVTGTLAAAVRMTKPPSRLARAVFPEILPEPALSSTSPNSRLATSWLPSMVVRAAPLSAWMPLRLLPSQRLLTRVAAAPSQVSMPCSKLLMDSESLISSTRLCRWRRRRSSHCRRSGSGWRWPRRSRSPPDRGRWHH